VGNVLPCEERNANWFSFAFRLRPETITNQRTGMKPTRIFLITFSLSLPLALWLRSTAVAEATDELKALPSTGQGRQVIVSKLDRIRLDRITYDGLPLGEVVKNLMDEAKKRDPEKKGINFVLTSNGGPDGPPGEPAELVDINSIIIKIMPPLSDVRLAEALDAIVVVADRPIQYSIEDYGVVFTLKRHESERKEAGFVFSGGTPKEFLEAVEKQFKVNWSSVADIPEALQSVHIPALRMDRESLETILRRERRLSANNGLGGSPAMVEGNNPLEALVALYNSLQQAKPDLGRLVVEGDFAKPSVVMFVAPHDSSATSDFQMRAFPLKGIPKNQWEKLARVAEEELASLAAAQRTSGGKRGATLRIHQDTGLLVVLGPAAYLDTVGSFVTAWQANSRFGVEHPALPAPPQ